GGVAPPGKLVHLCCDLHRSEDGWMKRLRSATDEIAAVIPPGETLILVDQDEWATDELIVGRRRIPFLERDGRYWGAPPDDDCAIGEVDRLRQSGAGFIVFGWPAFWWLDHYSGLHDYLRSAFRCVLEDDRLVVFDLRPGGSDARPEIRGKVG